MGFVFSRLCMGSPQTVTDFVKNLELYYSGDSYLSLSAPVALPQGRPLTFWGRHCRENGLPWTAAFSVVMPDSFTVLFDAGTKAEQYALLEKADRTLDNILRAIRLNWSNFFRVKKGREAQGCWR